MKANGKKINQFLMHKFLLFVMIHGLSILREMIFTALAVGIK